MTPERRAPQFFLSEAKRLVAILGVGIVCKYAVLLLLEAVI